MVMTGRYLYERLVMIDQCELGAATADASAYAPTATYAWTGPVKCGVLPGQAGESGDGADTPTGLRTILFALGTDLGTTGRIRVTHRAGRELATPEVYDVVGVEERLAAVFVTGKRLG